AQDRSRGAPTVHPAPAPAPALGHRKTSASPRVYAAFLQNAPVVRLTSTEPSRVAPTNMPSGAGPGRSEPWKRTPKPLAHSAKALTPQSFLSERRLDPAEPPEHPAPEFVWLPPDGIIAASVQQSLDPDLHLHRAIGQPLVSAPDRQGIGVVSSDRQLDVVLIRLTVVGRI
ncbi:MAG: hypothetical protein RIS24_1060, partial [Verrucomicrobiota bacterium]